MESENKNQDKRLKSLEVQVSLNYNSLRERLDLLELKAKEPGSISKVIANKINRWDADDLLGMFLGGLLITFLSGAVWMVFNIARADDIPIRCEYYSKDSRWYFTTIVDWRPQTTFGPFETLEVTKEAAQLSGCPSDK